MNSETPNPEDEDGYVPVEAFIELSARLAGRIQALETMLQTLLSERVSLADLERRADAVLLHAEASKIADGKMPEEAMRSHEWASQSLHALFRNATIARDIK
ncbi:hypothetical protein [Ciceribacter ferrooxidans]|uniref:Uncharacterized protein n=1 Tax=Ciceribacter ferrooxidans TaxID=2509717 RepID=A0A4V1RPQ2_9HYPH|nr:hypothetical protein [Ciceribacter ferrooxidans]RYC10147.1 hypothetical protein EUU22_18960 [Ciceribacter ferrooxidans]